MSENYYYVQIQNEIAIGVQQSQSPIVNENLIKINFLDVGLLGKKYQDGEFVNITPPQTIQKKLITRGMFKLRMTQTERIATRVLAMSGTGSGMIAMDFNDLRRDVPVVDLDQQEVKDGINFLEAVDVLGEGRASEILNAEITEEESP